jgi:hypothetical protein
MVISRSKHTRKRRIPQASPERPFQPNKINANMTFDFEGKNLTPYGGLFPVATMLEKLKFQELIEEIITVKRRLRAMSFYQFLLSMVLAIYVGFSRLHHPAHSRLACDVSRDGVRRGVKAASSLRTPIVLCAYKGGADCSRWIMNIIINSVDSERGRYGLAFARHHPA